MVVVVHVFTSLLFCCLGKLLRRSGSGSSSSSKTWVVQVHKSSVDMCISQIPVLCSNCCLLCGYRLSDIGIYKYLYYCRKLSLGISLYEIEWLIIPRWEKSAVWANLGRREVNLHVPILAQHRSRGTPSQVAVSLRAAHGAPHVHASSETKPIKIIRRSETSFWNRSQKNPKSKMEQHHTTIVSFSCDTNTLTSITLTENIRMQCAT